MWRLHFARPLRAPCHKHQGLFPTLEVTQYKPAMWRKQQGFDSRAFRRSFAHHEGTIYSCISMRIMHGSCYLFT